MRGVHLARVDIADQPGHRNDAVIHRALHRPPLHLITQHLKGLIGSLDPSRLEQHRRAAVEWTKIPAHGATVDRPGAKERGLGSNLQLGVDRATLLDEHHGDSIEHMFEVGGYIVNEMGAEAVQPNRVPMIARALRRRCPVCGSRKISRHPVHVHQHCPTCELNLERRVGSFIGGVGVNTVISFAALLVVVIAGFAYTRGEGSLLWVLLPALGTAVLVPCYFYARSRLLWVAIEVMMVPLEADEVTTGSDRTTN